MASVEKLDIITASGETSVGVGGNISDAAIVPGDGNVVGNQAGGDVVTNIYHGPVYQGGTPVTGGDLTAEKQAADSHTAQRTAGEFGQFAEYLAVTLRSNNWTTRVLLLDALLFATFNPVVFRKILDLFTSAPLPQRYPLYFWLAIGAVFVAAGVAAWRARPIGKPPRDLAERRAIRCLLPYGREDAFLFARLQREHDLTECLQAITDPQFRFGVLCGDSGNGKTSFLQAGLWPALLQINHRCVYVKCTELDPIDSIRQAIIEHLSLSGEAKNFESLPAMLEAASRLDATKPLVVLLDQFEQFFVHRQRKEDREPFLQAMEEWYRRQAALPVKIVICLRSDYFVSLFELLDLMGLSLGPHQRFKLEKLSPAQAAEIFRVIAEQENLECDSGFVEKIAAEELAGAEDGLVSPVDIQVLAWMIAGQKDEKERAFNQQTFQKLGGVEGLLERFLARALDVRETEQRRQAAVKVLLALTDLDRNTRAGVLTTAEIEEKLTEHLPAGEIAEAVAWLARGDVRLISPVKTAADQEVFGYELAHERLIPALRRIAGKQLSEADRVNQLLDRRVNEWLGNNRSARYLLTWRELRRIRRQNTFLVWGAQKSAKESLVAKSRRRVRQWQALTSLPVVVGFCLLLAWNSTWGQLYLVRRGMQDYVIRVSDNHTLADVTIAYLAERNSISAQQFAAKITDRDALILVARAYIKLGDTGQAVVLLDQALKNAETLLGDDRVFAFSLVAKTYIKLGDRGRAAALIEQALKYAETTLPDYRKAYALISIADVCIELNDAERATLLLEQALKNPEKFSPGFSKAFALNAVVRAVGKLNDARQAMTLLEQVIEVADTIYEEDCKADVLSSVAEVYIKLDNEQCAMPLLEQAVRSTQKASDDSSYAFALSSIARAASKLSDARRADLLVVQAFRSAQKLPDINRAYVLSSVVEAYIKLNDEKRAALLLEQAIKSAEISSNDFYKAYTLNTVIRLATKLGKVKMARDAALLNISDNQKASALALILRTWANRNNLDTDEHKDELQH